MKREIRGGQCYRQGPQFKEMIRQRDNYACQTCGRTLDGQGVRQLDVAHIVPYKEGGSTTPDNVRVLCHSCNQQERVLQRKQPSLDDYYARLAAQLDDA